MNLQQLFEIPLDRGTIQQDRLNLDNKTRSNLLPWSGQFSPEFVHALLAAYAQKGDHVVDPFMGSGTVLVESARMGLASTGADINAAAYAMATTYRLANYTSTERREITARCEEMLAERIPDARNALFNGGKDLIGHQLKQTLVDLASSTGTDPVSCLMYTLVVLADFYREGLTSDRLWSVWSRLRSRIDHLPHTHQMIRSINCDARQLPLMCASADLIVSSPPYINVFNYHQQYRASVEALGWDVLRIAQSEIGANRKHRGNRFLTVVQYCLDMAAALFEMKRVLKSSGRVIVVVGRESAVRKTRFFNGDIVARLAVKCVGLMPCCRQERVFRNRFGTLIYEDILHFSLGGPSALESARDIANNVLNDARTYAPAESVADLQDALNRIDEVAASPIYVPQNHHESANATP